jgi:hypothetical protein
LKIAPRTTFLGLGREAKIAELPREGASNRRLNSKQTKTQGELVMAIYQTGAYQVKPSAVGKVKQAIEEFVRYVPANEPGTKMYLALPDSSLTLRSKSAA